MRNLDIHSIFSTKNCALHIKTRPNDKMSDFFHANTEDIIYDQSGKQIIGIKDGDQIKALTPIGLKTYAKEKFSANYSQVTLDGVKRAVLPLAKIHNKNIILTAARIDDQSIYKPFNAQREISTLVIPSDYPFNIMVPLTDPQLSRFSKTLYLESGRPIADLKRNLKNFETHKNNSELSALYDEFISLDQDNPDAHNLHIDKIVKKILGDDTQLKTPQQKALSQDGAAWQALVGLLSTSMRHHFAFLSLDNSVEFKLIEQANGSLTLESLYTPEKLKHTQHLEPDAIFKFVMDDGKIKIKAFDISDEITTDDNYTSFLPELKCHQTVDLHGNLKYEIKLQGETKETKEFYEL